MLHEVPHDGGAAYAIDVAGEHEHSLVFLDGGVYFGGDGIAEARECLFEFFLVLEVVEDGGVLVVEVRHRDML